MPVTARCRSAAARARRARDRSPREGSVRGARLGRREGSVRGARLGRASTARQAGARDRSEVLGLDEPPPRPLAEVRAGRAGRSGLPNAWPAALGSLPSSSPVGRPLALRHDPREHSSPCLSPSHPRDRHRARAHPRAPRRSAARSRSATTLASTAHPASLSTSSPGRRPARRTPAQGARLERPKCALSQAVATRPTTGASTTGAVHHHSHNAYLRPARLSRGCPSRPPGREGQFELPGRRGSAGRTIGTANLNGKVYSRRSHTHKSRESRSGAPRARPPRARSHTARGPRRHRPAA